MINRTVSTNRLAGSTIQGGSVPAWSASQNNVARQMMMGLMAGGLSKAGAAGVIGNAYQESALDPTVVQANGEGHYLCQWGGSRLAALGTFANSIGQAPTSVQAQTRFIIHELKTSYSSLYKYLQGSNDPGASALAVSNQYERPAAASANNPNRIAAAIAAYNNLTPASGYAADGSGQGGSGSSGAGSPGSILDLITSPVDTIGGWLASIAVTLIKDTAQGIGNVIIVPFWHWQQRSVMAYSDQLFSRQGWPMLPWTGAFWGLGYFLLFTDPDSKSLKPMPVNQARTTKHARALQSLPARRTLIKPKDVQERTPKKPTPKVSRAVIKQVSTMSTTRPHTVTVTGGTINGGRRTDRNSESGGATVKRTGEIQGRPRSAARRESDAPYRSRRDPLPASGRHPTHRTKQGR